MHCDITGFTAMSEALAQEGNEGAELMTDVLNRFFERMLAIAELWGGEQLKFGGDAMLLFFAGPNHADRAAACGLAMQAAMREFRNVSAGGKQHLLRMRAGIHSGRFFTASLGESSLHYIVGGSEASRSAQVEALAPPGGVVVSPEAAAALASGALLADSTKGVSRVRRVEAQPPGRTPRGEAAASRILARYLMPQVADLLARGRGEALVPEHRHVTPTFISLLGLQHLLETEGDAETLRQLNAYVSMVIECAENHNGSLAASDVADEGEKLIILLGAPVALENEEAAALRFALDLDERLLESDLRLKHRLGIASGFVYAGEVGSEDRREYTVIGDVVNLAARLMAKAKPGEAIVSDKVAERADEAFTFHRLRPLRVKGKAAPVRAFRLEGRSEDVARASASPRDPILGRERELSTLTRLAGRAQAGRPNWAYVAGDPGIGKSRLVAELASQLTARGWRHAAANCHAHTAKSPYAPWLSPLRDLLGLDGTSVDDGWIQLLRRVRDIAPGDEDTAPLLAQLLRITIPAEVQLSGSGQAEQQRLFHLIADLIDGSARDEPLLLTIEDLHWSDSPSRELLAAVIGAAGARLMACITSRSPEPPAELAHLKGGTVVALDVLPEDASRLLLAAHQLAPDRARAILRRAQGNPLFLHEIARGVGTGTDLPETITDVMMTRLDALPPEPRSVIRAASVIGPSFELSLLAPLLPERFSRARVTAALSYLQDSGFTIEHPQGYAFNHILTQQVAYEALPYSERRRIHARVGSEIEERYAGRLETTCELLLYHFEAARQHRKTALYALMSGDRAAAVFANYEAIDYYERSMQSIEQAGSGAPAAVSLLDERIGDCLETAGKHTDAAVRYEQALETWRRRGRRSHLLPEPDDPRAREAAICRKLAVASERASQYDGSLRWLDEALHALPRRRQRLAAEIAAARSTAHFRKGQYDQGITWGLRAVALARRTGDPRRVAYARNMLANSYMETGELRKASAQLRRAVRLYGEARDFPGQASANNNLGKCYHLQGVYDAALYHYQVALAGDERSGDTVDAVIVHHNIGEALLALGRIEEAVQHFDEVVAAMRRDADLMDAGGLAELNLCRCRIATGDLDGAQAHLGRALRLLRRISAFGLVAEASLQRADLLLARERPAAAAREARRSLAEIRRLGNRLLEARGERLLGRALSALGRADAADRMLRAAIATSAEVGAEHEEALARTALAAHLLDTGARRAEARRLLARATSVLSRMGAMPDLASAQQLMARAGA
jgi:class 3 adenylate cyclase/tetratricopeptide (TPR) repeat protein